VTVLGGAKGFVGNKQRALLKKRMPIGRFSLLEPKRSHDLLIEEPTFVVAMLADGFTIRNGEFLHGRVGLGRGAEADGKISFARHGRNRRQFPGRGERGL